MQVLLNNSLQEIASSISKSRDKDTAIQGVKAILGKSICPYCSYTLLRHISLRAIYWRCSHCHQELPVSSPRIYATRTKHEAF